MIHIVLAMLLQAASGRGSDTTVSVPAGARLRLQNQGGDITIRAWDRNQVRVQAEHSSRSVVDVDLRGQVVEISTHGRQGVGGLVDYIITVPASMAIDVGGMYAEISIEGVKAAVKAQTLDGNITLKGGGESVNLSTVNGRIAVSGARGRIELHAVSDGVAASDIQGDLVIESVSGDIDLRRIDAKSVDAQTISGEITFEGRIADAGSYSFNTHSGNVTLAIPETSNATLTLSSASGEMNTTLSLKAERETRRRHSFRLGSGSATVDVETFSGDLDVVHPAELKARHVERDEDKPAKVHHRRPGRDRDKDDDRDEDQSKENES